MIIHARDISTDHIGHAVSIPHQINPAAFVLRCYNSLLWQPNHWTGPGRVDLYDRGGRCHSLDPDDQVIVESR